MSYKVWDQIDEVIVDIEVLEVLDEDIKFHLCMKHKKSGTTLRDKVFFIGIGDSITMVNLMLDKSENTLYNKVTYKQEVI